MNTEVHIAGVGSTKFGFHPDRSLQSLAVEAARAALADSNVPAKRIGCLFVGNFVGGIMTYFGGSSGSLTLSASSTMRIELAAATC